tara:strand:+ start:1389 stop:1739 length:351 start_codon:yes stop_codon:yes gene_type:complete
MARRTKRRSRSRRQRGGMHTSVTEEGMEHKGHEDEKEPMGGMSTEMTGGRKRRRKGTRKARKGKGTKKKSRKKRKLNKFFALMLAAKKKGLKSFKYNGKTYKGKKHRRLGMIYKKA